MTRDRGSSGFPCLPWLVAGLVVFATLVAGVGAQQPSDAACRLSGRVSGAGMGLPGVALTIRQGDRMLGATSTSPDGTYRLPLPPGTYELTVELAGFTSIDRSLVLEGASCHQVLDLTLTMAPRATTAASVPEAGLPGPARRGGPRPPTGPGLPGRQGSTGGFQTLMVERDASAALVDLQADDEESPPLLLPPGFGAEASSDAIAVTGAAARVDRGMLNDRQNALARGDIDLSNLAAAVGGEGGFGALLQGPLGAVLQQAGVESLGDLTALAQQVIGRGGGPGPGGFVLGGRGGRQNRVTATADYTFNGSALDSAPYQLRGDGRDERPYTRQNFGATLGGPLRLPGIYNGENRTNVTLTYNGGRGSTLFDQYGTVPTAAMRAGDFSSLAGPLIDPVTGLPFANNQIPADRMSSQARALLRFIPEPNLPGDARNYQHMTTTASTSDGLTVRLTHNFTPAPAGRGGPGGRAGGRGGAGGFAGRGAGARGGALAARTNVILTSQLQLRRTDGDQHNVFETLGGRNASTTIGLPVSLNVVKGRNLHALNVNLSRTSSSTHNQFTGIDNVAGEAGILGISSDPFAWGVPALSFASLTGLRDVAPSRRTDRRVSTGYTWTRPLQRHAIRAGGDVRFDRGSTYRETTPNGAFVFTGLYTSGGDRTMAGSDFADFLLGLPQQASVQHGTGDVVLTGRSLSLFLMDDWRARPNLTLNLGLRYELLWPYVEARGQLVNLDVTPDFSAAAPVVSGGTGAFSGTFPDALIRTDTNNLAPRVGIAWRLRQGVVVRGGYGISYNAGSYGAIARQLASQPPFAVSNTRIGALNTALLMEDALAGGDASETTNSFGVDRDYMLGRVHTWNADVSRNLGRSWAAGANYTHTRGSSLDVLRAPNRDASGLRIEGVQPFTWQSAEGSSVLHSASFRLDRRQVRGLGWRLSYTLARSRDNAPSIGGGTGATVVAQDDRDLDSEWALSNFDRRHRFTANLNAELPVGPNRRWLTNGGTLAALLENWRLTASFSADSGTPLTARVRGATRDVAQGLSGALRADATGAPLASPDRSIDQFFNTSAFAAPAPGLFGTSARNIITGPGSRQLDGQLARDIRLGGTRALTVQVRATNLLNMVNYSAVDTYVNSPTFGQVLSVRPMRSAQMTLRFRF